MLGDPALGNFAFEAKTPVIHLEFDADHIIVPAYGAGVGGRS
jgi:hypothetical protein